MAQARYERLSTSSNQHDDDRRVDGGVVQGSRHTDDDDNNEEIALGTEHHIKYEDYDDEDTDINYTFRDGGLHRLDDDNSKGNAISKSYNCGGDRGKQIETMTSGARFMQMAIGTLATILLYLTLSICLTFYQKRLIRELKFPLSIVCYHLVIKLILAACVRAIYKCHVGKSRVELDWRTSLKNMAPTGIASGIDIGFSNWGLELVSISLYTMTKSSTIVFILFFAILLGLEKKSWLLMFTVGLIACGLFMFTYKSTQFDALGFIFILVASLSSGVRWSFAQFLMQKTKLGLHNPIDMIYHMQPWMILAILPFVTAFEGQGLYDVSLIMPNLENAVIYRTIMKITFGAVLAFVMEISEFLVLSKTSGLTLSIAGIFKDVCQLALAVELDNDALTLINVLGLVVCIGGICCHVTHKYSTLTKANEGNGVHYNEIEDDYDVDNFGQEHCRLQYTETGIINTPNGEAITIAMQKNHSAQRVPLLEQADSEVSSDDADEANASDVIFDVLKRRDIQR